MAPQTTCNSSNATITTSCKGKALYKAPHPEILGGLSHGVHGQTCCWSPWAGRSGTYVSRWAGLVLGSTKESLMLGSPGWAWSLNLQWWVWDLRLVGGPWSWVCGGWPGVATFGASLETGAVGLAWRWGGPATGVWVKWDTRFTLLLSQEGHFSLNWAIRVWGGCDRSNVKLYFLPFSIHLFLFLCFTKVL